MDSLGEQLPKVLGKYNVSVHFVIIVEVIY